MKVRSISANQMILLAPAFLNYVKDVRVHLVAVLRKRPGPLSAELHKCCQIAVRGMKKEIECRLQLAVAELRTHFPQNEFSLLAQRAPWDLIQISNKM